MKLEEIGFYTLSDSRAQNTSINSPLQRCELVLTDRCNFKCTYCRGMINKNAQGEVSLLHAFSIVKYWTDQKLKNVRFTGGEPTLYAGLKILVEMCKFGGVEHIAISTNGSASQKTYQELIDAGVNDFSVSLDSGCCTIGDKMAGVDKKWPQVVENIKFIASKSYITAGMVFTEDNIETCVDDVLFADSLGVTDIRVIPSAQYNKALSLLKNLPKQILSKYPILRYRINNIKNNRHIRGLSEKDCGRCWLAMDDMACAKHFHFPCIIHLREGGDPIGEIGSNMRKEREQWLLRHNSLEDPICRKNCLDVCVDYNNRVNDFKKVEINLGVL